MVIFFVEVITRVLEVIIRVEMLIILTSLSAVFCLSLAIADKQVVPAVPYGPSVLHKYAIFGFWTNDKNILHIVVFFGGLLSPPSIIRVEI